MRSRRYKLLFLVLPALMLSACARLQMNASKGPGWYRVKPTDTLYSIAWRYDLDFRDLARWNGIGASYRIYPGQQLRLIPPKEIPAAADSRRTTPADTVGKPAAGRPGKPAPAKQEPSSRVVVKPLAADYNRVLRWSWPTDGRLLKRFSRKQLDRHGIDIAGKIGQPVRTAEAGKVVYSGNGLSGYGNLVIVKHSDLFLSAYAHNRDLKVKEGQWVRKGDVIASMGKGRDGLASLHFQIRRNGKPVDQLRYLPPRQDTR
jgi:lipoprotein NlpD